jgi:TolB-like protein/DNA-binding winged helix-turn-helix (wHTH) protein/Tfp pilus assembly protein PilF
VSHDPHAVSLLRFSVFEFDPATPELRRNGRRVPLQDMPLRVLEMLLEQPNELVSRETFFTRLWPHDETGILDDNLNTAVRKLRLALNDSAHYPRFIETVPKRGYRFLGPVARDGGAVEPVAGAPEPTGAATSAASTHPWMRRQRVVASVAAVIAAAALVFFLTVGRRQDAPPSASADASTLAVLPFVNASDNAADEYFSHGLTEELMDRLARAGALKVVSRTSAFALKGQNLGAREVGEMLGAGSLVEGSVRREGDRVRISARLVSAHDGLQLWSETYDRRLTDVIDIQEEIARSIATKLTGRLGGESPQMPVVPAAAYDQYLKGRFYWQRRTQESLRAAAEHFEAATQNAPDYAPAWAGLGDAYAVLGFYDYLPPAEAFPKAQAAAGRALQLDPDNASAEATLGYAALYFDWDLGQAEERFQRSVSLDPSSSKAHQWFGNLLTAAGRFDEAEREMRRAQQLEPLSLIASAALGWSLYHSGRHERALEQYRLTLALDPEFELAYLWSGWALEALGRYDEALAMLNEAVTRSRRSGISTASLARLQALRGEKEEAARTLTRLIGSDAYLPAYEISKAWLALDDSKQADKWLQRAFEQRSHSLVFLRVDPQLAAHREHPAVQKAVARIAI